MPGDDFDASAPSILPNAAAMNAGYAGALGSRAGHDIRRLLFEAYWLRGVDIASAEVCGAVRRTSQTWVFVSVSAAGGEICGEHAPRHDHHGILSPAHRMARVLGGACPVDDPTVVDGRVYVGVDSVRRLGDERARFDALRSIEHD